MRDLKRAPILKRAACVLCSAVLILTAGVLGGCSTPEIAAVIKYNGKEETITTGEYLAYLYNAYNTYASYISQMESYSYNPWADAYPYDEGDVTLPLEDLIVRATRDSIVRQRVLLKLIDDYKLTIPEERLEAFEAHLSGVLDATVTELGFNKKSYASVFRGLYKGEDDLLPIYESALFFGLYGEGGSKQMAENDIQTYYDDNILTYMIITRDLTDSSGKDLSSTEVEKIRKNMQRYLEMYEQNGDFDAVIKQASDDAAAESSSTTTTGSATDTTATTTAGTGQAETTGATQAAQTTETTAAQTTAAQTTQATAAQTTTAPSGTASTGTGETGSSGGDEEEEEETDSTNLTMLDAGSESSDENLAAAIQEIEVGKAAIKEYKAGGTTKTMALILRVDPEETVKYTLEKMHDQIIVSANQEEYTDMIKEEMKNVTIDIDAAVLSKCTPKRMKKDIDAISG